MPIAAHDTIETDDERAFAKFIYVSHNGIFYEKIYRDTYVLVTNQELLRILKAKGEGFAQIKNADDYFTVEEESIVGRLRSFFGITLKRFTSNLRHAVNKGAKRVFLQRKEGL